MLEPWCASPFKLLSPGTASSSKAEKIVRHTLFRCSYEWNDSTSYQYWSGSTTTGPDRKDQDHWLQTLRFIASTLDPKLSQNIIDALFGVFAPIQSATMTFLSSVGLSGLSILPQTTPSTAPLSNQAQSHPLAAGTPLGFDFKLLHAPNISTQISIFLCQLDPASKRSWMITAIVDNTFLPRFIRSSATCNCRAYATAAGLSKSRFWTRKKVLSLSWVSMTALIEELTTKEMCECWLFRAWNTEYLHVDFNLGLWESDISWETRNQKC